MTFLVSCAAGTLHINIAITRDYSPWNSGVSHAIYAIGIHKEIQDKKTLACAYIHFKLGTGLGSPLPHVAINNQYLFHNQPLLYLAFRTIDISQSG